MWNIDKWWNYSNIIESIEVSHAIIITTWKLVNRVITNHRISCWPLRLFRYAVSDRWPTPTTSSYRLDSSALYRSSRKVFPNEELIDHFDYPWNSHDRHRQSIQSEPIIRHLRKHARIVFTYSSSCWLLCGGGDDDDDREKSVIL